MKRRSAPPAHPQHDHRIDLAADGLLSVADAMEFLGIGHSELYAMLGRGELPSVKIGRRRLLPRAALVRFIADRLPATTPAA